MNTRHEILKLNFDRRILVSLAGRSGPGAGGKEKVIKNITTDPRVKLDDGTEEEHKITDTKDPKELKNLAQWILSR